jgi:hypothetical protein
LWLLLFLKCAKALAAEGHPDYRRGAEQLEARRGLLWRRGVPHRSTSPGTIAGDAMAIGQRERRSALVQDLRLLGRELVVAQHAALM